MFKKALIAAAIAGMVMPIRPVEAAPEPETPPPDSSDKPKDDNAVELPTVVVEGEREGLKAERQTSANKLPLSIRETPQSVTVITQESLRDRQVTDLGQALELSAGATSYSGTGPFGGMSSFGFNDLTIRGISIDGYNDVREDSYLNNSYFTIPDMAIYDRIEVVKGPNSVNYGRGSVGGLINRVRKKPLADAQTDVALSVGSYDSYRLDVDTTGPMFSSKDVRGRVVAAYDTEGAFVDGVHSRRGVFAPSIDANLTPGTHVLAQGLVQIDRFASNNGIPLTTDDDPLLVAPDKAHYRAPNISRSKFLGVPTDGGNRWSIYSGSVQIDQNLGDQWLGTLRFSGNKTLNKIRNDRYVYGFYTGGDSRLSASTFDIGNTVWSGELRISGDFNAFGSKVKLAAGAEFNDNDYHRNGAYATLGYVNIYNGDFAALPDQPLSALYQSRGKDKNQGYYVQAQVKPAERLSVLLGLRYDRTDSSYVAIGGGAPYQNSDSAVTGRIGLTYELSNEISAYAMYGTSFLPQLFSFDQNDNVLNPETGKIYEAGLKTEWFDGRLGVNAAVYRVDRKNIPVSVPTPDPADSYSVSSGLQRSDGAEVEVNGTPLPGWKLSMAYNVLNSQFKDPADSFYGHKPGGSANWQYAMFSSYELQSGPAKGLGAGLSLFAIPERGLSTFQGGTLAGYERVDLHLFYTGLRNTDFRLLLRNVTDARYIEGADRFGALAQFGSPRAVMFTMTYSLKPTQH